MKFCFKYVIKRTTDHKVCKNSRFDVMSLIPGLKVQVETLQKATSQLSISPLDPKNSNLNLDYPLAVFTPRSV